MPDDVPRVSMCVVEIDSMLAVEFNKDNCPGVHGSTPPPRE
jgi:hypothetical protein